MVESRLVFKKQGGFMCGGCGCDHSKDDKKVCTGCGKEECTCGSEE